MADEFPVIRQNLTSGGSNDDLFSAMKMFQDGVQQYAVGSAFRQAKDAVDQIGQQQLSEDEDRKARQDVANQLAGTLGGLGQNAASVRESQAVFAPPTLPQIQTPFEAYYRGALAQGKNPQEAAEGYMKLNSELNSTPDDPMAQQFKNNAKVQGLFNQYTSAITPEKVARSVAGKRVANIDAATNLQAAVGNDTSPDALNKLSKTYVQDAARSMATLLNAGTVTEGELKMLMPENVNMSVSQKLSYLTSHPEAANQGEFLKMYLDIANREQVLNQSRTRDSIVSIANGQKFLATQEPDEFKNVTAQRLTAATGIPYKPSDIIIGEKGDVTTKDIQQEESTFDTKFKAASGAKDIVNKLEAKQRMAEAAGKSLSSAEIKALQDNSSLLQYLQAYGDKDGSNRNLLNRIRLNVRMGAYEKH